jgi:HSP20 family protein
MAVKPACIAESASSVQLDPDRVVAEYRDGILALSLPRAESDKPKAIKVN